jgi:hypothetical protein
MEHIDAARLNTDTLYRFNCICKFIGFDEQDIKVLHDAAPVIAPLVPVVVGAVYDKLHSYDVTWEYFVIRNKGYTGTLPKSVTDLGTDDQPIQFRKHMLTQYLTKLVTADYDDKFVEYLDSVAKIHTSHGGNKSINVEYVHINALLGYVQDILLKAICDLDADNETKTKLIRAVSKLLCIQNDMFGKYYLQKQSGYSICQLSVACCAVAVAVGTAVYFIKK